MGVRVASCLFKGKLVISDQSISGFSDQGSECRHQRLALDGAHWQSMPSNE